MDEQLFSALNYLNPADLNYTEWIQVGMALKEEGYPCSVWDEWSRNDSRYHSGECEKKWMTFKSSGNPVKAGSIIQMAKDRGWTWKSYSGDGCLDWDSVIEYDGISEQPPAKEWKPTEDLITYLKLLFDPDDYVAYVSTDVYQTEDGKWVPSKGNYDRTAGELIASLRKYPKSLDNTIGSWKEEAGAWIRFNPVDGKGVSDSNVTAYRYALVESDTLPIQEQDALYRELELPIAALVYSGKKSLHAIVHIDADNKEEYYKRVNFLYDYLEKQGLDIDKQNRNPSRLSRMPGVTRNGKMQYLAASNIGQKSWIDWVHFVEGIATGLPKIECLADFIENPPELAPELIGGILRQGHKMLLSGPPKAGKSFSLMELAISIAEGKKWLGYQCTQGKVLYINLEIDPSSVKRRFRDIYDAWGIPWVFSRNLFIWNLRGNAMKLDELAPKIIRAIGDMNVSAVILDPIYKVITGDENSATDMGFFCNQFDKICSEAGVSMIYCHHHSKGAQGGKKAMDRASGSGVFARDPDALIDMTPLEIPEYTDRPSTFAHATAWRIEFVLREFPSPDPVNVWFKWPLHVIDDIGFLKDMATQGSAMGNLSKSGKNSTKDSRKASVMTAYEACSIQKPVTVKAMAEYMGVSERCARDRINESEEFTVKYGVVFENETEN